MGRKPVITLAVVLMAMAVIGCDGLRQGRRHPRWPRTPQPPAPQLPPGHYPQGQQAPPPPAPQATPGSSTRQQSYNFAPSSSPTRTRFTAQPASQPQTNQPAGVMTTSGVQIPGYPVAPPPNHVAPQQGNTPPLPTQPGRPVIGSSQPEALPPPSDPSSQQSQYRSNGTQPLPLPNTPPALPPAP